jgi:hypothetical protein
MYGQLCKVHRGTSKWVTRHETQKEIWKLPMKSLAYLWSVCVASMRNDIIVESAVRATVRHNSGPMADKKFGRRHREPNEKKETIDRRGKDNSERMQRV